MAFVHGHAREAGWVVSHFRRPQFSGQGQLDLELPAPRAPADDESADPEAAARAPADDEPAARQPDRTGQNGT